MNDYSQSRQDEWVLSIMDGLKGYFVDLGAFDGRLYSNTLRLEENGWDGLCIEANPKNFKQLIQNRKCNCLNMAIAMHTGRLRMTDDASTSQRSDEGKLLVPCDRIGNILRQNNIPKYIDYISSDLERMDADIWETFPFKEYSFGLATVEHALCEGSSMNKKRIMKVMLDNGYVLAKENVEHDGNIYEDWYKNKNI